MEIVVNGGDSPVLDGTPNFVKSIPIDKALDKQHAHCLRDERRTVTALQRLSDPPDRTRLDRHVLDETSRHDRSLDQTVYRVLDDRRLSHSGRQVSNRPAFSLADDGGE